MKTTYYTDNYTGLAHLLDSAKNIGNESLSEAASTDSVDSFPEETLAALISAFLLTASISSLYGGQNLGLLPQTNLALLNILKNIGSGNLVMGRVLEGHLNAQILIDQYGTESQKQKFAKDAFAGKLFGVWNTQAKDGTFFKPGDNEAFILSGSKTFATGTDYVSRPIVTGSMEDGSWQMCVVPLDEVEVSIDRSWWNPMGMQSSRSYKITFEDALIPSENILGDPDIYYRQPGFSGGSIRFAAVQLGAAERLLEETRIYLRNLGRTEDPFQKMRLGQMAIAVESGNQWLRGAAEQLDRYMISPSPENSERFLAFANMMRTAIEQICTEVMALCQKSVGARGLNKPYHFERIIRDLSTYLRQPAPDASLADIGQYVLGTDIPSNEMWNAENLKSKNL